MTIHIEEIQCPSCRGHEFEVRSLSLEPCTLRIGVNCPNNGCNLSRFEVEFDFTYGYDRNLKAGAKMARGILDQLIEKWEADE